MNKSFNKALSHVKTWEGGKSDHPSDPGGATNMGITLRTYRRVISPSATVDDLWSMSWETAAAIYRREYWDKVRGNLLPVGLDLHVFDMAVNAGPRVALKLLQTLINNSAVALYPILAVDGVWGPNTKQAVGRLNRHMEDDYDFAISVLKSYKNLRLDYYKSLRDELWETFGKGWTNRVMAASKIAHNMVWANHHEDRVEEHDTGNTPAEPKTPMVPLKAVEDFIKRHAPNPWELSVEALREMSEDPVEIQACILRHLFAIDLLKALKEEVTNK